MLNDQTYTETRAEATQLLTEKKSVIAAVSIKIKWLN